MINKQQLIEIIINKGKKFGLEKGRVHIFPEILEDEKFYFFGLTSEDPFLWESMGFLVKKETGQVHDIDMEIEQSFFENQYEKMKFDDDAYKMLCEYLETNHKETWMFIPEE